jgi:hypothetical protein
LPRGEVLVAILNNLEDLRLAREAGWYRIPVTSARKWLGDRWPPRLLAFYQTKVFGPEAYAVNYCAAVRSIRIASRMQLFPDMPRNHPKASRLYYQLLLDELQMLPKPIVSRRLRRIVFIPTTFVKFKAAAEINDLWDESPLEDRLWAILKRARVRAERQYPIEIEDHTYFLDFAIFCDEGKIDVETDGDTWHIGPESAQEIHEHPADYCLSKVEDTVNHLGGLDHTTGVPVRYDPDDPLGPQQLGLFDPEV